MVKAAHEVVEEAQDAGVWVFGGGLKGHEVSVVATDGMITDGPYPDIKEHIGGFAIVDVPSREEALKWAAKIAVGLPLCARGTRAPARPDRLIGGDPPRSGSGLSELPRERN